MLMFGFVKIKKHGNHKWLNYNEQVELLAVLNGHRKVEKSDKKRKPTMKNIAFFSFTENKFAIGSSDKNIAICYYDEGERFWAAEMIKKKQPKSTVTCIAWHPNNQIIAVGSCDYRVRIYTAFIKAIEGQAQTSAWGKISTSGELLHELQNGKNSSSMSVYSSFSSP